jgi:two-component system, sensor histidine kinase
VPTRFALKVKSKWSQLSVAGKLYSVFGIMAFLIGFELVVLSFAMSTLSSVRAFVAGEGQWSKAQKDAMNSLHQYILTSDPIYYYEYQKNLEIPLGDRLARQELEKQNPNYDIIFKGFLLGMNHQADIDGMIKLLQRFHWIDYIAEALTAWKDADTILDELLELADGLHQKIENKRLNRSEIYQAIKNLDQINERLTIKENLFSNSLGKGSRWLERILFFILLLLVLTVELTGITFTFTFSRNLSRGLNNLKKAANEIGQGDFDQKVEIESEDELGQLAQAINQMANQLKDNVSMRIEAEEANKTKSLFLANMSHEIRTPLTSIMGFAELLKNIEISEDEKTRFLNIIQNSGETLSNVINDILDISKVESGHLSIENVNFSLHKLLNDLKNLLRFKCDEKGLYLKFEIASNLPDNINTDPLRLRQILLNLLSNSIKFTEKGNVTLSAKLEKKNLVFDIYDTGLGIPQKDQKIIFEHFRQSDNSLTRKYGGTGLGLPLSLHLSLLLDGHLELIESKINNGSHFRVTIAFHEAIKDISVQNNNTLRRNNIDLKGLNILVAEDAEDIRLLIKVILEQYACHVDFAEDGVIAIEKAQAKFYDIILLDIQMPRLNGYETITKLRELHFNQPIIAQTAHAMRDEKEKCIALGFDEILTKPIMPEVLISTLAKLKRNLN